MFPTDIYLISNSIIVLLVAIAVYVSLKNIQKQAKQLVFEAIAGSIPYLKDLAEQYLNSEKGQKALMQIGGLIGNGAKIGFGFDTRRKGGLQGLATELISGWIQNKVAPQIQQQAQQQQPQGLPTA